MRKCLPLIAFVFLLSSSVSAQHHWYPPHPHHPHHAPHLPPGEFDGFMLKFSPLALLPAPVSEIRIGGEYCIANRFGIGVDFGYVFHSTNNQPALKTGDGIAIHPDIRYYLGKGANIRFFAGLQAFYREEYFGAGQFEYVNVSVRYTSSQTSATKDVKGAAVHGGFLVSGGRHFRFELGTVIGIKDVSYSRDNEKTISMPRETDVMAPGENVVLQQMTMPYLSLDLKICYRAGR